MFPWIIMDREETGKTVLFAYFKRTAKQIGRIYFLKKCTRPLWISVSSLCRMDVDESTDRLAFYDKLPSERCNGSEFILRSSR